MISSLLLLLSPSALQAAPAKAPRIRAGSDRRRSDSIPGEFIVKYRSSQDESQGMSYKAIASAQSLEGHRGRRGRFHVLRVMKGQSIEKSMEDLRKDPSVEYVQPNYIYNTDGIPSDPSFGVQWAHRNTGQVVEGGAGLSDADMDTAEAWDAVTGSSAVIVALLDTGIDIEHPDLSSNVWTNVGEGLFPDQIDNDGNGWVDDLYGWDTFDNDNYPLDLNGHGTHVGGIIGAVGNNGIGVAGVAWKVRIMAVKTTGVRGFATSASLLAGIEYARVNGAKIINASWGGYSYDQALKDAVDTAGAAGILFVAAAGNDGTNNDAAPLYPASFSSSNVIAVAATDKSDALASFSNFGAATVDLGAPGKSIYSTIPMIGTPPDNWGESMFLAYTFYSMPASPLPPTGMFLRGTAGHSNPWSTKLDGSAVALQDSPEGNYANNADSRIWMGPIPSTRKDANYRIIYSVKYALESGADWLDLVSSSNLDQDAVTVFRSHTGTQPSFTVFITSSPEITSAVEAKNAIGLRLDTDASITADGVKVDYMGIEARPLWVAAHTYGFMDGTSMAAPQVSGVAALLWSLLPNATAAQVKAFILNNVDALPALAGKSTSGGRVNAQKAVAAAQPFVLAPVSLNTPAVLGTSSITWSWNDLSNETGYRVRRLSDQADLSGPLPAGTTFWTQTGLSGNSRQELYVEVFNTNDFRSSASRQAVTAANPPGPASFTGVFFTSATLAWGNGGNAAGTVFQLERSLDNQSFAASYSGTALSTVSAGLSELTTYYYRVRAENGDGILTAYTAVVSTRTREFLPETPSGLSASTRTTDSITWVWADNASNEDGYRVRRSTDDADLSGPLPAGATSWMQTSLTPNLLQQVRVEAFRASGGKAVSSSSAAYTLADAPSALSAVAFISSATVSWTPGGNPAGTVYIAEQSSNQGLSFNPFSSGTGLSAVLTGLLSDATYYFRVRARNGDAIPTAYSPMVSTKTINPDRGWLISSLFDGSADADISLLQSEGEAHLYLRPNSFAGPVFVTLRKRIDFPTGASSPVYRLLPTGVGLDVSLDPSWQPFRPATLSLPYEDADVAGLDERNLVLARYDPSRDQWVVLPGGVDADGNRLTAATDHFSLFQIMALVPGISVDETKAFPNPLRPGRPGHTALTFSSMPADSALKIFTLQGELVRQLRAGPGGDAPWDATNDAGQPVASGVYLVRVEGTGGDKILKVAVQR